MSKRGGAGWILGGVAAGIVTYVTVLRGRQNHWGATEEERAMGLAGDEEVSEPRFSTTRAVSVGASPGTAWHALLRVVERNRPSREPASSDPDPSDPDPVGGFGAEPPGRRTLRRGERVKLSPRNTRTKRARVARLIPGRVLLLRSMEQQACWGWSFCLFRIDAGTTRLVVRFRSNRQPGPVGRLIDFWVREPAHFLLEREMILRVKRRSERIEKRRRRGIHPIHEHRR